MASEGLLSGLSQCVDRAIALCKRWDRAGSGRIDRQDFWRAVAALGLEANDEEIDWTFDQLDTEGAGTIDYTRLADALQPSALQQVAQSLLQDAGWVDLVPPPLPPPPPPVAVPDGWPAAGAGASVAPTMAPHFPAPPPDPAQSIGELSARLGDMLGRLEGCLTWMEGAGMKPHAIDDEEGIEQALDLIRQGVAAEPIVLSTRTVHEHMRRLYNRFATVTSPRPSNLSDRAVQGRYASVTRPCCSYHALSGPAQTLYMRATDATRTSRLRLPPVTGARPSRIARQRLRHAHRLAAQGCCHAACRRGRGARSEPPADGLWLQAGDVSNGTACDNSQRSADGLRLPRWLLLIVAALTFTLYCYYATMTNAFLFHLLLLFVSARQLVRSANLNGY